MYEKSLTRWSASEDSVVIYSEELWEMGSGVKDWSWGESIRMKWVENNILANLHEEGNCKSSFLWLFFSF